MTERVMLGHFLTRREAAQRARINLNAVQHRPDLLRLRGRWLEETYFAFQFGDDGSRRAIGDVVRSLKESHGDIAIADWLVRPNPLLGNLSPLEWLRSGRRSAAVVRASGTHGPIDGRRAGLREADACRQCAGYGTSTVGHAALAAQ